MDRLMRNFHHLLVLMILLLLPVEVVQAEDALQTSIGNCAYWNSDPSEELVCALDVAELISSNPVASGSLVSVFGILGIHYGDPYIFLDQIRFDSFQRNSAVAIADESVADALRTSEFRSAPSVLTGRLLEDESRAGLSRWRLTDVRVISVIEKNGAMRKIYKRKRYPKSPAAE